MRFMISVVDNATVKIAEHDYEASIQKWLLIYVGIGKMDVEDYAGKIQKFVEKISTLKCFHVDGKINSSITDVSGSILLISNFTLYGRTDNGQKIDFSQSADYESAEKIYNDLIGALREKWLIVETGIFGAYMEVSSVNAGPLNFILDY